MPFEDFDAWPPASELGAFVRRNTDWDMDDNDVMVLSRLSHVVVAISATGYVPESLTPVVATAAAVVMGGGDVAFLAYVCVDKTTRRQGLARRAVLRILRLLETEHGLNRVMLVATQVAEPLYRQLGFTDFPSVRVEDYKYVGRTDFSPATNKTEAQSLRDLELALAIVANATDGSVNDSRSTMLKTLVCENRCVVEVSEYGDACAFVRRDEIGHRLGPVVASSLKAGVQAVKMVVARITALSDYRSISAMAVTRPDSEFTRNVLYGAGFESRNMIPFLHLNCATVGELSISRALANPCYLALAGFEHL